MGGKEVEPRQGCLEREKDMQKRQKKALKRVSARGRSDRRDSPIGSEKQRKKKGGRLLGVPVGLESPKQGKKRQQKKKKQKNRNKKKKEKIIINNNKNKQKAT